MKEIYEHPEMEIILFANGEDVVVTSAYTRSVYQSDDGVLSDGILGVAGDSDS